MRVQIVQAFTCAEMLKANSKLRLSGLYGEVSKSFKRTKVEASGKAARVELLTER